MDTDELPSFQLTELVDELARSSDEEGLDVESLTPNTKMVRDMASDPEVVKITPLPAPAKRDEGGPSSDRSAGERIASAFWRCAHEAGFTMLCEALTFTGLRDELPRLMAPGHTIMAPTNEAWAKMDESVRKDPRLVRQLLLGHMCAGVSTLHDLRSKNCACAVAGQTHAVYDEGGHTRVGTGRFGRTDLVFDGGVIHEVTTVLMVLSFVRDSHTEQVRCHHDHPHATPAARPSATLRGVHLSVHLSLVPRSYLDRISIVPRSYLDRTSIVPRSYLDRTSIVSRSYLDRISIVSRSAGVEEVAPAVSHPLSSRRRLIHRLRIRGACLMTFDDL
jgi:uncharacterized surface protein with fasciclin (FAS1) repeats